MPSKAFRYQDMTEKQPTIFLSSTTKDLKKHRKKIKQYLREQRYEILDTVEEDVARPDQPLAVCLADVARCDVYVVLVSYRYGFVPKQNNPDQLSMTELEYRHASQLGKRRLVFIAEDINWPSGYHSGIDEDPAVYNMLKKWRLELMEDTSPTWKPFDWINVADLAVKVLGAVQTELRGTTSLTSPGYWPEDESPYPGLISFDYSQRAVYFGRDKEIRLAERILEDPNCRFLIVSGASGSGKSSFVEAGLLPTLLENPADDDYRTRFIEIRIAEDPNFNPLCALANAFNASVRKWPGQLRVPQLVDRWQKNPSLFGDDLVEAACTVEVVVLDQMEELFTLCDEAFKAPFINALVEATRNERLVLRCVLSSIRNDYRDRCQEIPELAEVLSNRHYLDLFELHRTSILDMIQKPAQIAGLDVTGVDNMLLEEVDASPGNLPLLAATLAELWQAREGKRLTSEALNEFGGIGGVITRKAEAAFKQLTEEKGSEAAEFSFKAVFSHLVRVKLDGEPTRATASKGLFIDDSDQQRLIELFSDSPVTALGHPARLLVVDTDTVGSGEGDGHATVDVAHEALFRSWERLAQWIASRRKDEQVLARAAYDSREWHEKGKPVSLSALSIERLRDIRAAMKRLGRAPEDLEPELRDYVFPRAWLLSCIDRPMAEVGHAARAHIGDLLDQMDIEWDGRRDDRPGVGVVDTGLPDGGLSYWVDVHAGEVELELEEGKRERVEVASFRLAKYPVTKGQFLAFLEADDGYRDSVNWPEREEAPSPYEYYGQSQFAEPVTYCAWFEAVAFGRWITRKMRALGVLTESQQVRLPLEAEWQLTSSGCRSPNAFPWGDDWGEGPANTAEAAVRRTVAVGLYPAGATQDGLLDLSGNTWEWCLDKFERAKGVDFEGSNDARVVHGGSFGGTQDYARVAFRNRKYPNYRDSSIGFRLCLSSPIEGY